MYLRWYSVRGELNECVSKSGKYLIDKSIELMQTKSFIFELIKQFHILYGSTGTNMNEFSGRNPDYWVASTCFTSEMSGS